MNPDAMPKCNVCGQPLMFSNGRYYHALWNGLKKDEPDNES